MATKQLADCPSDDELLAFIPGELAPEQASSVTAHLETCPSCRSRLTTLRQRSQRAPGEPTTPPTPRARTSPALPAGGSDAPTTLLPQTRLPEQIGQYKLLKQIGRGGMGLVFLARHVRLGRTVALKVLPGLQLSDRSAIVRLQREIAAAGRVQHPNIVFATDANAEGGIDYLVMEHIDGVDIGRLVADVGPLPCPAACEIIRQAALGLAHIHACALVHRDLKPSNLMLASDGVVKILDLGLALLREGRLDNEESQTQTGYLLGTADYVSPEQLHDPHDADVRSDLYSLGCTFYKLLAGQAPFSGADHSSLTKKLDAHRYKTASPITQLRPDAPPELDVILARLLAKEPADRIQEPAELAELLAPFCAGADLPALVMQVAPRSDLDDLPLPTPSQTPLPATASTHPQGKTPTPNALALPRRRPALFIAGGFAVAAIAALIVLNMVLRSLPAPISTTPAVDASPEVFPGLAPALATLDLTNGNRKDLFVVTPDQQRITAVADGIELIQLGDIQPGTGVVKAEFSLPAQGCEAGFFFGYKPTDKYGDARAEALLVALRTPVFLGQGKPVRLLHGQVHFLANNAVPLNFATRTDMIDDKPQRRYRLEIHYTPQGIETIRLDGQGHPAILQTQISRKIDPQSLWGVWGIYANGSTIDVIQPTLQRP